MTTIIQPANNLSFGFEYLGSPTGGGGSGNVLINGGNHTVTTQLNIGYNNGSLNSSGNLTLGGGTLNTSLATTNLGFTGPGTLTQNGGTHLFNQIYMGVVLGGAGTYSIGGGGFASGPVIYCGY